MPDRSLSLASRAALGLVGLLAAMAAALFLSAGSLAYWQGWASLFTFALCSGWVTAWLARRDPALLRRRLNAGPAAERDPRQKAIQAVASAIFLGLLIVPGFDHRFGWSRMPLPLLGLGHALMVAGYAGVLAAFRENSFASSVVEVAAGQKVVETGPYAVVRHPMYAAALPLCLGIPLALGSFWGLLLVPAMGATLALRLVEEERTLADRLPGYAAYRRRVRWRLVPGVW